MKTKKVSNVQTLSLFFLEPMKLDKNEQNMQKYQQITEQIT